MDLSGLPYVLDAMRLSDVPTVSIIEAQVFATPWSAEAYRQELTYHEAASYVVVRYTDVEALQRRFPGRPWSGPEDHGLLGYAGLWRVLEQGHISTIAVRSLWRGRGLGELLLASLIEKALAAQAEELTLEVRVSNRTAQNLYIKYGFEVAGRRARYYPDNREDAWIMCTPSLQSSEYRTAFARLVDQLRNKLLTSPLGIPSAIV